MGILERSIPIKKAENCGEIIEINCDGDGGSADPSTGYEVVFPVGSGERLPLSGGAVVKLDFSNLPTRIGDDAITLLEKEAAGFDGVFSGLKGLVDARIIINSIVHNVGKSGALSNFPKVTLCTMIGDDSSLDNQKANANINKICSLKYIPPEVLEAIGFQLFEKENIGTFGSVSNPIYGSTGFKFSEYSDLKTEELTIAACIDLLPFYNVSEKNIVKRRGETAVGGYFTVVENNAFLKIPDLTGRDSAGFDPDLWNEEENRNLYIEILNDSKLTRITIANPEAPPAAIISDYNREFPEEDVLEIELDTNSDIDAAYLSLIIKDPVVKTKGVKSFQNGIELSTIPMLTKPVYTGFDSTKHRTYEYKPDEFEVNTLKKYYDDGSDDAQIAVSGLIGDYGKIATDTDVELNYIYGEQNRPEIVLADRSKNRSNGRNNRKYKNEKMSKARPLFAQTRPRLYSDIPKTWINGTISGSGNIASFSAGELKKIVRSQAASSTEFALYLKKGDQVVRVPGANISLESASPVIKKISPNGFIGSDAIDSDTIIRITGENLDGVNELILSDSIGEKRYSPSVYSDITISVTKSIVTIKLGATAYSELIQNSRYELSLSNSSGVKSNQLPIYISLKADAVPYPDSLRALFSIDEFSTNTAGNPSAIPILSDGQSAEISVLSKSKLFSGNYPIYAYFALPDTASNRSIMNEFDLNTKVFTRERLLVAGNIQWELKQSSLEDFAAKSNRKAVLRFPGSNYYGFNFSKLIGLEEANLVILNDSIANLVGDREDIDLNSNQFGIINIGEVSEDPSEPDIPAFIAPGHITAIIADVGEEVLSLVGNIESKNISEEITVGNLFDNKKFKVGPISVHKNIPKLAIIFSAAEMPFMRKRYDFLLDGKSIKNRLVDTITMIDGKEAIAIFTNVSSKSEGILGLGVKVNDKRFGVTYDSSTVYGTVTGSVSSDGFDIDDKTRDLALSVDIPTDGVSSFVNEDSSTVDVFTNLITSYGNGVIVSNPGSLSDFEPYNPISITSNQGSVTLGTKIGNNSLYLDNNFVTNITKSNIVALSKLTLSVPNGTSYKSGQYLLNSDGSEALVFNRVGINDGVGIGFNTPEIIAMSTTRGGLKSGIVSDSIPVNQGEKIWVRVKNVKKNFSVKIGTSVVKAVSSTRYLKGTYDAQITVPGSLMGSIRIDDCMVICASSTNADRLKAKRILGGPFVTDIENKMDGLLQGKLKDKIPDIEDLKALLCDVPLRFVNVDLCEASVPAELVNSFCDLSFQLLADLKLALNGFQVLMVPIQVIFCIIDVLCALINPVKTAQAMIRLFECLFDLILLLPQISVPVMFLKLILHLLQLLECVVDKVSVTIEAVNAIVPAMEAALKNKDWSSLKSLEEILSEYLYDLNVDLDILAPVTSILGVFLQLLQLVFRFPCQVTPADNAGACSIDGTMLAGIVGGVVSPDSKILPSRLIPVGQAYTNQSLQDAAADGTSAIISPSHGDIIAKKDPSDNLFITNMDINEDTLRASNSNLDFLASMAVSATKSKKGFKNPAEVEFQFKGKYEPGFVLPGKLFDPSQSGDSPLSLINEDGGTLKIASGVGNFISPIDGSSFMVKNNEFGSIKTLEEEIRLPIYEVNDQTSQLEEVGVKTVWKTFDGIPMMTILDQEFNLYFINDDGIEFDDDDNVIGIRATMVNDSSAPKLSFGREDTEIDSDGDGENDDTVKVYDFPQIYFVDMRACVDSINSMCNGASLNAFLLEDDNSDDVADIIDDSKNCLEAFIGTVKGFGSTMRDSMNEGLVPKTIDTNDFAEAVATLKECLNGAADNMCFYVVNTLTTSFKVQEDTDLTPSNRYFVPSIDAEELQDLGFEENPPSITGASEYADGDGETAVLGLGDVANIIVTPRDAMDIPLGGNLTDKITLEIVSDTTGDARFVKNENDDILTLSGSDYFAKLVSNKEGEVKLRVKVCNRTIQAVTYDGLDTDEASDASNIVDCIDDTGEDSGTNSAVIGALIKVDRIITVIYTRNSTAQLTDGDESGILAQPQPQQFGTSLEN